MSRLKPIAAIVPPELRAADELLTKYGRWAMPRATKRTCGSAEGNYRPPVVHDDDARRTAADPPLTSDEVMLAQRALAQVPERERVTLQILYIPRQSNGRLVSPEKQCRLLRLTPELMQQRHLEGLRLFDRLSRK